MKTEEGGKQDKATIKGDVREMNAETGRLGGRL